MDNCFYHQRLGPNHEQDLVFDEARRIAVEKFVESIKKEREMSNAILRCKMKVSEVLQVKENDGSISQERVKLSAVYGNTEENKQWSKWTPAANFEIYINNPEAFGKLSSGHEFFVDFIPVN